MAKRGLGQSWAQCIKIREQTDYSNKIARRGYDDIERLMNLVPIVKKV
jgi:hypothetical protein